MNINYENKLFNGEISETITDSSIPINYDLYKFPDRLSGKLNEFRQRIDQVKSSIYNRAVDLDRNIVKWNSSYNAIESMLESVETAINDRLFLRSDTDGFYTTIFENFTIPDYVDFINSYQVLADIDLHQVTLDHDMENVNSMSLKGVGIYSISVSKGPGSGPERVMTVPGSNLNNLMEDNLSGWTGSVSTKNRNPVSLVFDIVFNVEQDISYLNLGLVDPSRAMFVSASCVDEAGTASVILENASVSNANIIPVFKKVKKVQLLITKTNYDEKNSYSNDYKYIFHLTHLKVFAQIPGYKKEGIFYSNPFLVSDNKRFAIETCDFLPAGTNIEYYLSIENFINDSECQLGGGSGTGASSIITLPSILAEGKNTGTYTSAMIDIPFEKAGTGYQVNDELVILGSALGGYIPGNNLTFKVEAVDESGRILTIKDVRGTYVNGHLNAINPINKPPSSSAPYGLYIDNVITTNNINYPWPYTPRATYAVLPLSLSSAYLYNFTENYKFVNQVLAISPDKNNNNIAVYSNHSALSASKEDSWELKGSYYYTWVYNEKDENSILEVGDSGITIEGLPLTNGSYRLNKSGWFKVKVPVSKYFDVGVDFTDIEVLKNLDPLFPYNGKYLIEGTNLKVGPYLGFKNRAKRKLNLANNLNSLNNESFYLMRIPDNKSVANLFVAIVNGETDIKNAYIEYDQEMKSNFYNLRLIAKMKTNNVSITPILSSYKIKLGV